MNIFNRKSVFLGEHPFEAVSESTREIFKLAKNIKKGLGNQGYLLDSYLSMNFELLNNSLAHDAATQGFDVFSDLFGICTSLQGEYPKDMSNHPFYETAKKHIEEHPITMQEKGTIRDLHCTALASEFIDFAVKEFIKNEKDELRTFFEMVELQEYYSKIAYLVGEEKISRLSELLKSRFLIARPVNIFLQAITNQFLYCLIHRDKETSKQVFQLILDDKNERFFLKRQIKCQRAFKCITQKNKKKSIKFLYLLKPGALHRVFAIKIQFIQPLIPHFSQNLNFIMVIIEKIYLRREG